MISFYPGPSRVDEHLPQYMSDAYAQGILSINHRSADFMEMFRRVTSLLKERLEIPASYSVLFTSSATECWEILSQSFTGVSSYHMYNGAFGERWYTYAQRLTSVATAFPFGLEEQITAVELRTPPGSLICITQNETSNGTQVMPTTIASIKQKNPDALVAVDVTSSLGGIYLPISAADIWFASVQKCLGLPAGLGVMICSPQAVAQALASNTRTHYNSLASMLDMMEAAQTTYTPNVLAIYLLMRVMESRSSIHAVNQMIRHRYTEWVNFMKGFSNVSLLIEQESVRSSTVLLVKASENNVAEIKRAAKEEGFVLGEGYGQWKSSTFRIANFPAILDHEINALKRFLSSFLTDNL